VNAHGTGPQIMQDRAGNPLVTPAAMESIEPFEGLALEGSKTWDATTNVNLLSEDGTLHGFRLSGWRLEEDKTEVGVYQLTLTTVSGATLTYARSLRPRPAAGAYAPFEWASSGDNIIHILYADGRKKLALQDGSGRRLQTKHKHEECKENTWLTRTKCHNDYEAYQKAVNKLSECMGIKGHEGMDQMGCEPIQEEMVKAMETYEAASTTITKRKVTGMAHTVCSQCFPKASKPQVIKV